MCAEPSNINPSNQFVLFIPVSGRRLSLAIGHSEISFISFDTGEKMEMGIFLDSLKCFVELQFKSMWLTVLL